jgi:hypothetical protein
MAGSNGSTFSTQATSVPTVQTSTTALASNTARIAFMIQNQDTSALKVCFGPGASSTIYHVVLKGGTGAADGTGGSVAQEAGTVYNGVITVFSAGTPSYTVWEQAA